MSCRRTEKTKERTEGAVDSRFSTRVQLKKDKKTSRNGPLLPYDFIVWHVSKKSY